MTPEHDVEIGGVTVMVVCDDFVPIVAVIVAEPVATPVTNPPVTVAMAAEDVCQVTVPPVVAVPEASSAIAVIVVVWPTAIVFVGALSRTEAMAAGPVEPPPLHAAQSSRPITIYRI